MAGWLAGRPCLQWRPRRWERSGETRWRSASFTQRMSTSAWLCTSASGKPIPPFSQFGLTSLRTLASTSVLCVCVLGRVHACVFGSTPWSPLPIVPMWMCGKWKAVSDAQLAVKLSPLVLFVVNGSRWSLDSKPHLLLPRHAEKHFQHGG